MQIGLVGLGRLGFAMARHLLAAGRPLIVWDRDEERAEGLSAQIAASPADVVTAVKSVVLGLFDTDAVLAALTGPEGLLAAGIKEKLIIDFTTHDPRRVAEVHALVAKAGGEYLEAPVIGTGPASVGMLTILASGEKHAFERALPLLEQVGRDIYYMGAPGNATRMKLVDTALMAVVMVGLGEAIAFGERAGLQRETVIEILSRGAGNCAVLSGKREKLEADDFSAQLSVATIDRKLASAIELADTVRFPLEAGRLAGAVYRRAMESGQGEMDMSVVYETLKLA